MQCIKTGCTVLFGGELYHGDLFTFWGGLVLKGVPKCGDDTYSMPSFGQHYHCTADSIEFLGSDGEYGEFWISGVTPTDLFRQFLQQWSTFALPNFKEAK